jgi:hypothetical protein
MLIKEPCFTKFSLCGLDHGFRAVLSALGGNWFASQWHRCRLGALNDCANMIGPSGERIAHVALVWAAVVDAGDPAVVAGNMDQHSLDDVRLDAEIGQPVTTMRRRSWITHGAMPQRLSIAALAVPQPLKP